MSCSLNRYETYDVSNVTHDVGASQWIVRLSRPPVTCQDGQFVSKKAVLKVDEHLTNSSLSYNSATGRPVIMVPNEAYVHNINVPETSFLSTLFWILLVAGAAYGVYRFVKMLLTPPQEPLYSPSYRRLPYAFTANAPLASNPTAPNTSGGTTVINNSSGSEAGDFLTGMAVGNLLSGGHSHETRVDHYTEVEHEHYSETSSPKKEETYQDDSSSSDSSYSSDESSSSYSSDSGSDSGSSFDSDS
jgi:hypothetical protein